MAARSNTTGFHHHSRRHHHHHHHAQAISFQSGAAASEIITPPGNNNYYNHHHGSRSRHGIIINANIASASNGFMDTAATTTATGAGTMVYSGPSSPPPPPPGGTIISCSNSNSSSSNNNTSEFSQPGSPFGSLLLDTVPGLKHDAGLAVEWSVEEQYKLEEGLVKFADEPSIMKYIKIAAALRDKTVRDVALRCRWMTRKRRKQEDHNLGKKAKVRRDRIQSCLKTNMSSASQMNMATYAIPLQRHDQSDATSPTLIGTTRHLLEENNRALGQISANLTMLKLQENVDLFLRTRSNLTSILNNVSNMPGIISQMAPLPVFINEELASSILPGSSQCMMFGSSSGIHLKQEPGC